LWLDLLAWVFGRMRLNPHPPALQGVKEGMRFVRFKVSAGRYCMEVHHKGISFRAGCAFGVD
jgi:hypothetical protein